MPPRVPRSDDRVMLTAPGRPQFDPFVLLEGDAAAARIVESPGGAAIEVELGDAAVEDLVVEFEAPVLTIRRLGREPLELRYALLSSADVTGIRATFAEGRLRVAVRRRWSAPTRVPIHCDFLWEGRVAHRPGEPLRPRPRPAG